MYDLKARFALLSIRGKIITAFIFGCTVIVFSLFIGRIVFKETFNTITVISKPDPKLMIINDLFQKIQRLDHTQKMQVLSLRDKPYSAVKNEPEDIPRLLDSLEMYCAGDTVQVSRIEHMKKILEERDELFISYLKFRYSIIKNNPLSKDIHNLSDYISKNIKKGDSNVVKTTKKNVTTTTILELEKAEKKEEKKESFFKRVFSRKKNREEMPRTTQKSVTEDVQETVDTFAVAQRDSFMKDMAHAISTLEKDRYSRRSKLADHELKLAAAGNIFINELQQLLRQVQREEILELQNNTESLSSVFNTAFNWIEIILCAFLLVILILIFLIFSDISQSNKARLKLIEAKEKAEYLEQVKHRFLANMSHEIRTPLQAIIGYSEQVKDQADPKKESLEAIYRSSEYLLQIVNEVLDYSRIVSGKFVIEKRDFDMTETIAEIADIMEGQAEQKGIGFRFKSEIPAGALYTGDPFRLKQILFNLLGNAIKFTDSGDVSFFITSKKINGGKTAFVFEIIDTGIGMTGKELGRVFNSFEQAGESTQRQYGGTGLGLSIAKQLTEMQDGTITVSSEKNKGSKFVVALFYEESLMKTTEQLFTPVTMPAYKGKVLVVDDDVFILQLCATILQKYNIDHSGYSSPVKLLAEKWDDEIDLVLIDIRMPVINGIEVFKRLKKQADKKTRFVALTAQALPGEKETILKQGFDHVLLKPFQEKDLVQLFTTFASAEDEPLIMPVDNFDLSSIKTMCDGDKALLKKNLELLVQESVFDLDAFTQAVNEKDRDKLAERCHRLAAKVGQVGMNLLAHKLRLTEKKASGNQFVFDKSLLIELAAETRSVIEKIKANT